MGLAHAHSHGSDEEHGHSHDAEIGTRRDSRRLGWAAGITFLLLVAELIGGTLAGSLALLADAGHMAVDLLALIVALAALAFGARPADGRRTFGYRRLEILAALVNGLTLVAVAITILVESHERWQTPRDIDTRLMLGVAAIGLVANGVGLWLLRGKHASLNLRAAFLHVLGDTLSSVAVCVGAVVMEITGYSRLDALLSAGIALLIAFGALRLVREAVDVLLEAAPRGLDTAKLKTSLGGLDGVAEVHDLHVWSITSGVPALSAHIVVRESEQDNDTLLSSIQEHLRSEWSIAHSTLQIERRNHEDCGSC